MNDLVIVVPSYKPNEKIMQEFIDKLSKEFNNIVIVDDGSGEEYQKFFASFKKDIVVLKHYINLGKGRAIKTAFNYCLNTYPNIKGVITCDCDGQHSVKDIKKCAKVLLENPFKLVIGVRNFDLEQVPFKSRYGNKITRAMFSLFVGINITDTQSGLRGFGKKTMEKFLDLAGERYEYETNMLIATKNEGIEIAEVAIETIYIGKNETSHFNPVKDAFLIYKLFFKYIFASLSSFIIDILLFNLFLKILPNITLEIVIATIISRVISSLYNYKINESLVFKNKTKLSSLKYFSLVIIAMCLSAFLVTYLNKLLNINVTILKIIVDLVIFMINFVVQREWVFKKQS